MQWRKITSSGTVIDYSTNPTLVFNSIRMENNGQYSCVANNDVTEDDAVTRQTITVTVTEGNIIT